MDRHRIHVGLAHDHARPGRRGLDIVRAARDRHDGARRNPWNDIECGSYYARSMSAWQLVNAWSGLSADLVAGRIGFAPKAEGDFRCSGRPATASAS